ncbi:MAG: phosphoglycerate kinase [SAR324 cluster bacterium]|nr:phosphoglycerate kinase [SAR324 cluster bacterium]
MAILTVDQLETAGKRILVRVDFNVPIDDGRIADDTRIRAALPTLRHLVGTGAHLVIVSHLGRPKGRPNPDLSLAPVAERLAALLGQPVAFSPEVIGTETRRVVDALGPGGVALLENLRFHPGEEKNDPQFARQLAALADGYVSDAFGTVHRAHASTVGVAALFRRAACGFLIAKELEFLGMALERPKSPYVAILGGAKVGDKIPVIRSLLARADSLLIGGAMAYTFLKARGHEVGTSLVDEPHLLLARELMDTAAERGKRLLLPVDHVVGEDLKSQAPPEPCAGADIPPGRMGLDIGPETVAQYKAVIAQARMIVWNGPMGVFELPAYQTGTFSVARAVAASEALSIVGGGDSVAAVNQAGVADRIDHISTGGGASLEFLQGKILPGIAALTQV